MRHLFMHVLGCALPLLGVFLLPLLGVGNETVLFVFIVLMFVCHLFMLRGHSHDPASTDRGGSTHEHH